MSQIVCVEDNWVNSAPDWPVISPKINATVTAIFILNINIRISIYFIVLCT